MKNIPNLQTSLPPVKPNGKPATYADLLNASLDYNGNVPWSVDLMRKRLQVSDKIADVKAGDMIKLGDTDFITAKEAVAAMVWNVKSAELVKFSEAFGA